ncbi:MAG: TolC family outer membrane protein [Magnetococcales bacterium]|nr:TolC family outer membrane protein [Magnetococcales bacterium]
MTMSRQTNCSRKYRMAITLAVATVLWSAAALQASDQPPHPLIYFLEKALQSNPRILEAEANLRATRERDRQTLAPLLPQITLQGAVGYDRLHSPDGTTDSNPRSGTLSVSQSLFNWQSIKARDQVEFYTAAAALDLDATQQGVVQLVVESAITFAQAREVERLAANNLAVTQRHLEATQARFQVGELPKTDVSQAKARLESARAEHIQYGNEVLVAIAKFREAVGENPPHDLTAPRLNGALFTKPLSELLPVVEQRPEVESALQRVRIADLNITLARAGHLPVVALTGTAVRSWNDLYTGAGRTNPVDQQTVKVGMTLPVYEGGKTVSLTDQARHQRDSQQAVYDQTRLQAARDLEQNLLLYHTTRTSTEAYAASVTAARDALAGIEQEFRVGSRTAIDLLDAQHELFTAETNLTRSRFNFIQSQYRLLRSVGQLTLDVLSAQAVVSNPS